MAPPRKLAAAAAAALLLLLCAAPAAARTSPATAVATWPARNAAMCARGGVPQRLDPRTGACRVPKWEATWVTKDSTIVMPCNESGFFDARLVASFSWVSFDWSNYKTKYVNHKPMTCEEDLVTQAALVKAVNPKTKVTLYRNLVKSLPW